jgi:HEAT repeat protein
MAADPDPGVIDVVARWLLDSAEHDAPEPLMDLLGDVARRPEAMEVLQRADATTMRSLLTAARSGGDAASRAAFDTIAYVSSRHWNIDDLRSDFEALDPTMRMHGVEELALVGSSEAVSELAQILIRDPSTQVRLATVGALARLGASAALEALRQAAHGDPDAEVRDAAAAAAEEIGDGIGGSLDAELVGRT